MLPSETRVQWAGSLLGLLVILTSNGCSTYSKSFRQMEEKLAQHKPAQALEILEKQSHPDRDKLLYLLNKAMLLRLTNDYAGSNVEFEKAKDLIQYLSAASITEKASSLVINDTTRSYEGSAFEQVLVHVYEALNYLDMGDLDAARVEALQVDVRLQELAGDDPDSFLSVDPFSRYLTGLIYEELGEWSDAMIAYRKAYEAYQLHGEHYAVDIPSFLKVDLLRCSEKMGLYQEHERYKKEFEIETWPSLSALHKNGELVLLFHNGLAPIKREEVMRLLDPSSGHFFQVALPYYEKRPVSAQTACIVVEDKRFCGETMEDISEIAIKSLEANLPAIKVRALARAAWRFAAQQSLKKSACKGGKEGGAEAIASLLFNVTTALVERADTRSWLTLPGEIQMTRVVLPPGSYKVRIELLNESGEVIHSDVFDSVRLACRKKTYLSYYWISSACILED